MVSTDRILAFAAMSLLVIAIPGPSVLFVIGGVGVDGRSQGDDTDDLPVGHQPRELLGGETVEAGGEGVVRWLHVLRLEADEMRHGVLRRPG